MRIERVDPKAGDVVEYHGRPVEIIEVGEAKAPLSGDLVPLVRVRDPRRGVRTMFLWQLEDGIGARPEPGVAKVDESFR